MADPPSMRVAAELRRRIEAGDLAPGSPIPTRSQLRHHHGLTDGQAQVVVRLLRQWGLVVGISGSRVVVVDPAPVRSTTDPHAPWPYASEALDSAERPATAQLAAMLGVATGDALLRERTELLDPDRRPSHLRVRWTVPGRRSQPVTRHTRRTITARAADPGEVQILHMVGAAAVLVVARVGLTARGRPEEVVEMVLPADRWQVLDET